MSNKRMVNKRKMDGSEKKTSEEQRSWESKVFVEEEQGDGKFY